MDFLRDILIVAGLFSAIWLGFALIRYYERFK